MNLLPVIEKKRF